MEPLFTSGVILVTSLLILGCVFVSIGNKKKKNDQDGLTLIIVGWVIICASVLGGLAALIIYIDMTSGLFGTVLFTVLAPIFIFAGFVVILAYGISTLVEGYRRNKEGQRDRNQIIKGWFMLALSIAIVVTVIVTLAILFTNHSNARNDNPVAFM